MSVINRMLRDLDKRQQQPESARQPAAIAPGSGWTLWHSLLIIGVILVLVSTSYWWFSGTTGQVQPSPVQVEPAEASVTDAEPAEEKVAETAAKEPEVAVAADLEASQQASTSVAPPANKASQLRASEAASTAVSETTSQPEPDADAQQAASTEPQPTAKTEAQPETTSPARDNASSLSIKRVQLSPAELAARNLEKAEEAFSKGDQREGQRLLEEALAVQPMNLEVRERLSAYWYGRGFGNRAIVLLNEGINLTPQASKLKLLLARIYQRLDMDNEAYQVLKGLTLTGNGDVVPLGQRAELAWRNQDYALAIQDYQRLTTVQPNHARWWLGLALALDDNDEVLAAATAYQQALQVGGLNAASNLYIEERLAQLLPLVEVN